MDMLKSVHIEGFKSIRDATIDLGPLTVLIGANGSGKSNFVSFLKMLKAIAAGRLQQYAATHTPDEELGDFVARAGGADKLLFFGADTTDTIVAKIAMDVGEKRWSWDTQLGYAANGLTVKRLILEVPGSDPMLFAGERSRPGDEPSPESWVFGPSAIRGAPEHVSPFIDGWRTYHFDNTSDKAAVRQSIYVDDNRQLHSDAGNLAAYLYMLREVERPYYDRIIGAFRLAAPWFDDFVIEPLELRPEDVKLHWREKGRDRIFGPHQLSDGSLRTIALFTLLLQPEKRLPSLVIIDEPELGLHPYAITMLAELLRSASVTTQVIVATQSVTLLNHFTPREIVTVERDGEGGTTFLRQSEERLAEWLERYSVGELWEKNVLGGRP